MRVACFNVAANVGIFNNRAGAADKPANFCGIAVHMPADTATGKQRAHGKQPYGVCKFGVLGKVLKPEASDAALHMGYLFHTA